MVEAANQIAPIILFIEGYSFATVTAAPPTDKLVVDVELTN